MRRKLKPLSDSDYDNAKLLAMPSGIPINRCPTCRSGVEDTPPEWEGEIHKKGTYRLFGEEYECDCRTQMMLRARYLVANIGEQYMRLDLDRDYKGFDWIKDKVKDYVENWEDNRLHGWGLEFGGPQGTGKTFLATWIGKELIKRNQRIYCTSFAEVVRAFMEGGDLEQRMKEATFLILDELGAPMFSEKQGALYALKFEILIRHRTNQNLPTIITTNLSKQKLGDHYPRVYSLLAAKQTRIDTTGSDAREGHVKLEERELLENHEVKPIC